MADAASLKVGLEALADELVADPNTPPPVLRFLYMWKSLQAAEVTGSPAAATRVRAVSVRPSNEGAREFDERKAAILEAVRETLVAMGSPYPVKTRTIFSALPEAITAQIGGRDPKSNLSAIIHNSKRFVSHGRAGWTLPEAHSGPQESLTLLRQEAENAFGAH